MLTVPSRLFALVLALVIVAALLGGCGRTAIPPKPGGTTPQPKPGPALPLSRTIAELQLPAGAHFSNAPAVSPDGSKVALLATGKGQQLWLYDLAAKVGRIVDEVSAQRLEAGTLLLRSVTWTPDQALVYIRQGTQPDGPHKDTRGLSFRVAAKEGPQEFAWVPVERGEYLTNTFAFDGKPEIFAHVSDKLWRVSSSGGASMLVKKDLPSPVGVMIPAFAPDGLHLTYQPLRADKTAGRYIMSLADNKEVLLVPRSAALTFGTEWSPDGKYVAYYYARRIDKKDEFEIFPAEDGPLPVTETIEIASATGQRVAKLSVHGLKLSAFSWAQDSKSIVFAAVSPKASSGRKEPAGFEWKSVYVGDLTGKSQKIADLPAVSGYNGLTFAAPGGAAYCLVYWNGGSGLYYVAPSRPAAPVEPSGIKAPFYWTGLPGSNLGNALVLTMDLPNASRNVIEVFESKATVLASGSDSIMLGTASGPRFAYVIEDTQKKSLLLRVMEVK